MRTNHPKLRYEITNTLHSPYSLQYSIVELFYVTQCTKPKCKVKKDNTQFLILLNPEATLTRILGKIFSLFHPKYISMYNKRPERVFCQYIDHCKFASTYRDNQEKGRRENQNS